MDFNQAPFNSGYLPEQDGHKIYFEQYGNVKGIPIINSHGGPGSHSRPKYASNFDLQKYHVILFDQRGCGQSLPQGEIKNNTLNDLIADMERLREQLKIEQWFVSGSSWGSTLSLAYAEAHPDRVLGLLIGSIFLGRTKDVEWSFTKSGGVERLFTDLWEERLKFLQKFGATPENAAKVLLNKILTSEPLVVNEVVAGVMNWEGNLMSAQTNLTFVDPIDVKIENINEFKIFLHYESNNSFLSDNQLLKNISKIQQIPAIIIHGRHDILCSLDQMWSLHKALPNSETVILPSSNHKLSVDGNVARYYAYQYFLEKNLK